MLLAKPKLNKIIYILIIKVFSQDSILPQEHILLSSKIFLTLITLILFISVKIWEKLPVYQRSLIIALRISLKGPEFKKSSCFFLSAAPEWSKTDGLLHSHHIVQFGVLTGKWLKWFLENKLNKSWILFWKRSSRIRSDSPGIWKDDWEQDDLDPWIYKIAAVSSGLHGSTSNSHQKILPNFIEFKGTECQASKRWKESSVSCSTKRREESMYNFRYPDETTRSEVHLIFDMRRQTKLKYSRTHYGCSQYMKICVVSYDVRVYPQAAIKKVL